MLSPFRKPPARPSAPVAATPAPAPVAYTSDVRFDACLTFTWRPDMDGQALHDTPGDSGGWTSFGVTLAAWASWQADHGVRPTTAQDLGRATKPQLAEMIRARYWLAVSGPSLPPGADLLVYDFGYGSGPGTSVRVLQEVVGVEADGDLGPESMAAIRGFDRIALIRALGGRHEAYYRSLGSFNLFGNGWTRRNETRLAIALATPA